WPTRRQGLALSTSSGKNRGRAVPLVHVAVNRHGSANPDISLHAAYGHRYIVDHAEPFAMIREGVMKSAADVDRRDILQRMLRRQNRANRSQPECINQFGRIRNLHLQFFNSGESPRLKFVYVIWFVYEEYVLIRRGLRSDEIRRVSYAKFNQLI